MLSSVISMPPSVQSCNSSRRIGRDAFETSVSPLQNFSNPPPVPEIPTTTFTSLTLPNSSAAASAMGPTVLDPSTTTSPERSPPLEGEPDDDDPSSSPPPQATAITTLATASAKPARRRLNIENTLEPPSSNLPGNLFRLRLVGVR